MKRLLIILSLAAALAGVAAHPAAAGTGFAVGVPADPVKAGPGDTVSSWIRLTNNTEDPLRLTIRSVTLRPQDDGVIRVVDEPDPVWGDGVSHPDDVTLASGALERVPVEVEVPEDVLPDLYLVGFVVEPPVAPAPGEVVLQNRIANYLVIDVPGPRNRSVALASHDFPRFVIGRSLEGDMEVANTGDAATFFRAQVRIDSGGNNVGVIQASGERQRYFPAATTQKMAYEWKAGGLFSIVRPSIEVSYQDGAEGLKTIVRQGPAVVIVPPETLAGAIALPVGIAGGLLVRARRRRAMRAATRRAAMPRPPHPSRARLRTAPPPPPPGPLNVRISREDPGLLKKSRGK